MSALIENILHYLGFYWLTGPVFDKELRVSSRQCRNYVLRSVYIFLLLTILILVWVSAVDYRAANVYQVSRMAEAGKFIITYIVWFQFIAAQVIAIIMLCNSISDEIYHKTLGMLMTTPITGLQIVMGKLFSKLLQLILLLAISMPLLAIVRMFGGVPWGFITSSLCLTFTTVLFVGSLSLFFSIFCRRSYVVIIVTVLTLLVLFALIPFLFITIVGVSELYKTFGERTLLFLLYQPNPYINFFFNTMMMLEPRASTGFFNSSVYINSGIFLVLSLLLLLLSIILVRKVALHQATGQLLSSGRKEIFRKKGGDFSEKKKSSIISVVGPPILWKELILPMRRHIRIFRIIGVFIFLAILIYSYWYFYKEKALGQEEIHIVYSLILGGLATLFTIVIPATSFTTEKESGAWPLLLTSTLGDGQIIIGKFFGALSRTFPVWLILLCHVIFFYYIEILHPYVVFFLLILITWYIVLLISSGLYFSSVFKHTTTAVIMNFAFVLFLWGFIPLVIGIISVLAHEEAFIEGCLYFHPLIQIIVIMISTLIPHLHMNSGHMQFNWPGGMESTDTTLTIFIISWCIYMSLAFIFIWRAKKHLRRKIF